MATNLKGDAETVFTGDVPMHEVQVSLTPEEIQQVVDAALSGVQHIRADGRECSHLLLTGLVKLNAALPVHARAR